MRMSRVCCFSAIGILLLLSLSGMGRASSASGKPELIVSVGPGQVQTFDTETISVTSLLNVSANSTMIQPSPGPISIDLRNANYVRLGYGCDPCQLRNGTYTVYVPVGEDFGFGTITVQVHDYYSNMTSTATFTTVLSAAYQLYLDRKERQAWIDNATAQVNAAIAAANTQSEETALAVTILGLAVILLSLHRIARHFKVMSWVDRLKLLLRFQLTQNPIDLIMKEQSTWARHVPLEVRKDQMEFEGKILNQALLWWAEIAERIKAHGTESAELDLAILEARSMAGLPVKSFMDEWKPGAPAWTPPKEPAKEGHA